MPLRRLVDEGIAVPVAPERGASRYSSPRSFRRMPYIKACSPRPIPCPRPPLSKLGAAGHRPCARPDYRSAQCRNLILRTAAAFAVAAIVTTARHSPEATGVLAKSASGALELVPIVTVQNLARALGEMKEQGFLVVGLDSEAARRSLRDGVSRRRLRWCSAPRAKVCGREHAPYAIALQGWIFPARSTV